MPQTSLPFPVGTDVRIPVLLDTDIGSNVDDLLAMLFTMGSSKLDLVGVTTVYGDTQLRAKVATATLELAGRSDIPVGYGIGEPLSGKKIFWPGHEGEGYNLAEVPEPKLAASKVYAEVLAQYGSDLVIAAIGPLTNVVEYAATSETKPRCVVAMAGRFNSGEPDRNVASDTVAAAQLMELGVPVVFVGIELCRQVPYNPTDLATIVAARPGHPMTKVIADRTQAWWDYRGENHSNPCDPLTLLALAHPELFEFQQAQISFLAEGTREGTARWAPSETASNWFSTTVDVDRARRLIIDNISACINESNA